MSVSIDRLRSLTPPALGSSNRAAPVEMTVYRVNGATIEYIEHVIDGDYHLVLADVQKRTLIAESPDPACAAGSELFERIRDVRTRISSARAGQSVSIEGAGFFDYAPNYARGQAPNGIELHPITAICFGTGCVPK